MMRFLPVLILGASLSASAALSPRASDDLIRYRSEVMQMGARLSTLEKEIGSKNNLYLTSIEQIRQFDNDVKLYRDRLKEIRVEVERSKVDNKKILQSYLLQSQDESQEPWQRKVHLELLKRAQDKLKQNEAELVTFEAKVAEFEGKLSELRKNEEELALVIKELESRKKLAMEKYLEKVEAKKLAEKKTEKKNLTVRLNKVRETFSEKPVVKTRPERVFARPVEDFLSYTSSPKGVTFRYQATQPVKAVGEGKVVFAGDLASYGQVVLVDHGNDLRTVLLGKMSIKVKKNDHVADGDVLAYTVNDTKEAQNLYFEVRKKNTAQNTILWLDLGGVSKI